MKTKHVNEMLLGIFLFHIVLEVGVICYSAHHVIPTTMGLLLGQLSLMIPAGIFFLIYLARCEKGQRFKMVTERFHFKKIKGKSIAMIIVFTYLMMPLTTVVNAISMLFVDNTMMAMSDEILSLSFPVMIFLVAILPAMNEEFIFRGMVYGAYRKEGRIWPAVILSGLVFGFMHMNINQAMYAFLLGVTMALLFEATGSIWATILFHFVTNGNSSVLMYAMDKFASGLLEEQAEAVNTPDQLFMVLGIYLVIAAITTPIAICILYWLSKNEKGYFPFIKAKKKQKVESSDTFKLTEESNLTEAAEKKKGQPIVTIPYLLFVACCLIYMIVQEILLRV